MPAARARDDHPARRLDRRGVLLGDAEDGDGDANGTRMGAPLLYHGSDYGVVYVESREQVFRQEDVDLLQSIATQAGLAIHATRVATQLASRERLERDLRVARQIQRSLLPPHVPQVVGLDFAVHYEPAYQIGGDFYDFIWHDPSHLGLAVGDVAGKAISAALYMARLTSELRSRAAIARTPARLLRRVNQEIVQLGDDGMFATLVYCIYDLENRSLVFTNAGHCVPLLRRGDRVFPLQAERAHTPPPGGQRLRPRSRRGARPAPLRRHAHHGVGRHHRVARRPRQRVRARAAVAPDPDGARQRRGCREGDPRGYRQSRAGLWPGDDT